MTGSDILVVVPHSGVAIPPEISLDDLTDEFSALIKNVDWYTQWLYDFRDILANRQMVFPYCSILLEANRDPAEIDECVPVKDVFGRSVYRGGCEPSASMRAAWSEKYLKPFHRSIEENISAGAGLLFDGHSTVTARGVADNQIDLMNFQHTGRDEKPLTYCPDVIVETYAAELDGTGVKSFFLTIAAKERRKPSSVLALQLLYKILDSGLRRNDEDELHPPSVPPIEGGKKETSVIPWQAWE
jgi:hypothetical protein